MSLSGKFIVIEGAEGVGKSTNQEFIRLQLEQAGIVVRCTREPGGTDLGERLRQLLLEPGQHIVEDAELLMMFAARAQHLKEVILPALAKGEWVLSDRFTDASYAYQGGGRGINLERIAVLEQWVQQTLKPDLVVLLDAPADLGLERALKRSQADRFEQEAIDFFERVRATYRTRALAEPSRYKIIDAAQSIADVQQQLMSVIRDLLQSQ